MGRLILLCHEPFSANIQSYSACHIDCIVMDGLIKWRFTSLYGNPSIALRNQSLQLLCRLSGIHEINRLPWLLGGI